MWCVLLFLNKKLSKILSFFHIQHTKTKLWIGSTAHELPKLKPGTILYENLRGNPSNNSLTTETSMKKIIYLITS